MRSSMTIPQTATVQILKFIDRVTSTFLSQDNKPKGEKSSDDKERIKVLSHAAILEHLQ